AGMTTQRPAILRYNRPHALPPLEVTSPTIGHADQCEQVVWPHIALMSRSGRVPQACGYSFGASPKPSASCASAGHESSKSPFHPASAPLALGVSALGRSTPRSSTGLLC